MSRRIVAAMALVFACGCGSPAPTAPKATSVSNEAAPADVKKTKKKGSNSTTKKDASIAPVTAPVAKTDEPAEAVAEKTVVAAKPVVTEEKVEVIPASYTKSVTLSVPDMHCEFACFPKVKKTLSGVPGVAGIKADIENHTVSFMADPAKFQEDKALEALKEAKYPATVKVADAK